MAERSSQTRIYIQTSWHLYEEKDLAFSHDSKMKRFFRISAMFR